MAFFLLEASQAGGAAIVDGVRAMVIEADSEAEAEELAAAQYDGDSPWDGTVTEIAAGVAADMAGFTYRIRISGEDPGDDDLVDVSVVGAASDDVDDVGAKLVTALNATTPIANASYSTPTLTVADIADGHGDHTLSVQVTAPDSARPIPQMVGTIVDEGIAAAVLTVVLEIPTAIPAVLAKVR